MATKQQALAAIWKDADERKRWYAGMAEAERREAKGEAWDYALGRWITRTTVKTADGKRKTTRSHPSADSLIRAEREKSKANGEVWKGGKLGWVKA
jgi:hypothetical protein